MGILHKNKEWRIWNRNINNKKWVKQIKDNGKMRQTNLIYLKCVKIILV